MIRWYVVCDARQASDRVARVAGKRYTNKSRACVIVVPLLQLKSSLVYYISQTNLVTHELLS